MPVPADAEHSHRVPGQICLRGDQLPDSLPQLGGGSSLNAPEVVKQPRVPRVFGVFFPDRSAAPEDGKA